MRRIVVLAVAAAALLTSFPAVAENRAVAVVERNYQKFGPAQAPDADALFGTLRAAGMRVASGIDLGVRELRLALEDLARPDPQPGARIVVLTGRFVRSDGGTWLLASDAAVPSLATADLHGVALSAVVDLMRDGGNRSVLLLGDASGGVDPGARLADGIGPVGTGGPVHVIAGSPQSVATATAALSRPGTTVASVLRDDPSLRLIQGGGGEVAPIGAIPAATTAPPARPVVVDSGSGEPVEPGRVLEGEAEAWVLAAARHSVASYEAFLRAFPAGRYAAIARARLTQLGGTVPDAAVGTTPTVPVPQAGPSPQLAEVALNLSRGEREEIQRQLTRRGYDTKGVDGLFGKATRAALTRWQQDNGRPATGYLDADAVRMLKGEAADPQPPRRQDARAAQRAAAWQEALNANTVAAWNSFAEKHDGTPEAAEARRRASWLTENKAEIEREMALGLTTETRKLVELRLAATGLRTGDANGIFDREDREAIRAFQNSRNLRATGFMDKETMLRLLVGG